MIGLGNIASDLVLGCGLFGVIEVANFMNSSVFLFNLILLHTGNLDHCHYFVLDSALNLLEVRNLEHFWLSFLLSCLVF